jgi:SNF2 family DNA or RNA helicase
MDIM